MAEENIQQLSVAENELRNAVARILVEDKDYLAAVRYYSSTMNCGEGEARRYVDKLNGILRTWTADGDLSFTCPHCGAALHIGQTRCEVCGSIVSADAPTKRKIVKTTWWQRNKGWVIMLIILQLLLIIREIILFVSHSNSYSYY